MLSQDRLCAALGPLGAEPALCKSLPAYFLGSMIYMLWDEELWLGVSLRGENSPYICLLYYCLCSLSAF